MVEKFEDGIIKSLEIDFDESCGGIGQLYFEYLKKHGQKVAVVDASTDQFETFSSLLGKCTRAAVALRKQGFKKQDTLAICSNKENLEANIPLFAGQFLGLITFSIDPALSVYEIVDLLKQVEAKIIFITEESKRKIEESLNQVKSTTKIVTFGKDFQNNYLKEDLEDRMFKPVIIDNLDETCVIHFSSGSTGPAKPICLNHYSFLSSLHLYKKDSTDSSYLADPLKQLNKSQRLVSLRYSNWYWISCSMEIFTCTIAGGCRILRDHFDTQDLWKLIDKYSITNLYLTPLQCYELSRTTKPEGINSSSLENILTGGYVLHTDFIRDLRSLLPHCNISQIYGMTECGAVAIFNHSNQKHLELLEKNPESCGLPAPGLQYKVVDLETGKICGPNQLGELYLKGKSVFRTFYNRDASDSFDNEGYFRTGDLVSFDDDFCFYIKDRIKSVLGWNDYLIYPHHIERVLLSHPAVYNAIVIGIPHKIESERLMGVVKLKANHSPVTEEELVHYVNSRVEDHKRLREGIQFVDEFEMTATGKVNRIKTKGKLLKALSQFNNK